MSFKYACYDKYAPGSAFVSNSELLQNAAPLLQDPKLQQQPSSQLLGDLRAAFIVRNLWDPAQYPVLKIAFLDGTEKQKQWVQSIVTKYLQPLVSKIQFQWNQPANESPIRISFALPGQAWSMVGTEALSVGSNQPTMNFGWLDDDVQFNTPKFKNTGQVVLHEFGHAMGMIHEHQNPSGNPIQWNKPVVFAELARTNGWDATMVEHNMFGKYGDYQKCQTAKGAQPQDQAAIQQYCVGELVNGSVYDVKSIMHYFFPATWMIGGPTIPLNLEYSDLDKQWLQHYYGGAGTPGTPGTPASPGTGTPSTPTAPSPTTPSTPTAPSPTTPTVVHKWISGDMLPEIAYYSVVAIGTLWLCSAYYARL